MHLISGAGNASLIGGPTGEILEGGQGQVTFTGGAGFDTFISPTSNNILIETHNADMSLFGNKLVIGTILGTNGGAYATSGPETEAALAQRLTASPLPNFTTPNLGDPYAAGAIVEDVTNLFATANLNGGLGNNTLVVGSKDGVVYVGGTPIAVTPWTETVNLDNKGNTADKFVEHYLINATGQTRAVFNVVQSNSGQGSNELIVDGTDRADNFTLNAAGSGAARVGTILFGDPADVHHDTITYRGVQRLTVNTFGGNDNLLSNDTAALTVVNFGSGDDNAVVGTVPLKPDPGNRTLEFPDGVPVADTDNMTNGNSDPRFILGGLGNSRFEVDHNRGMLYLHGGAGDSRFLLKTFLVLREDSTNSQRITNLATVFGGTGSNRYGYLMNAPVKIIGGPGTNTLVVHDETGTVTTGTLVARSIGRVQKVGQGADGKGVFKPALGPNGRQIQDVYYSLEGFGLGTGIDPNTVPFFGVEMSGVQNLDVRLPQGNNHFTVATTPAALKGLLAPMNVAVEGGAGNDTFNVQEARARRSPCRAAAVTT